MMDSRESHFWDELLDNVNVKPSSEFEQPPASPSHAHSPSLIIQEPARTNNNNGSAATVSTTYNKSKSTVRKVPNGRSNSSTSSSASIPTKPNTPADDHLSLNNQLQPQPQAQSQTAHHVHNHSLTTPADHDLLHDNQHPHQLQHQLQHHRRDSSLLTTLSAADDEDDDHHDNDLMHMDSYKTHRKNQSSRFGSYSSFGSLTSFGSLGELDLSHLAESMESHDFDHQLKQRETQRQHQLHALQQQQQQQQQAQHQQPQPLDVSVPVHEHEHHQMHASAERIEEDDEHTPLLTDLLGSATHSRNLSISQQQVRSRHKKNLSRVGRDMLMDGAANAAANSAASPMAANNTLHGMLQQVHQHRRKHSILEDSTVDASANESGRSSGNRNAKQQHRRLASNSHMHANGRRRNLRTLSNSAATLGDLADDLVKSTLLGAKSTSMNIKLDQKVQRMDEHGRAATRQRLHSLSPTHHRKLSSLTMHMDIGGEGEGNHTHNNTDGGNAATNAQHHNDHLAGGIDTVPRTDGLGTNGDAVSPGTAISNAFTGLHLDLPPADGNFLKNQKFGLATNGSNTPTSTFDVSSKNQSHIRMHSGAPSPSHLHGGHPQSLYDMEMSSFPANSPTSASGSAPLPLSMIHPQHAPHQLTLPLLDEADLPHAERKAKVKTAKRNRPKSIGRSRTSPTHKRGAATTNDHPHKSAGHVSQRSMPKAFDRENLLSPSGFGSASFSDNSPSLSSLSMGMAGHSMAPAPALNSTLVTPFPNTAAAAVSNVAHAGMGMGIGGVNGMPNGGLLGGSCVMSSLLPSPLVSPMVSPTNSPTNSSESQGRPFAASSVLLPARPARAQRPKSALQPLAGDRMPTLSPTNARSRARPLSSKVRTKTSSTAKPATARARPASSRANVPSRRRTPKASTARRVRRSKTTPSGTQTAPESTGNGNGRRRKPIPWTEEEDSRLLAMVKQHGPQNWRTIAEYVGSRTPAQVAQRWRKILNPELLKVNKGKWTPEEDNRLRYMIKTHGLNDWHTIADGFNGTRTVKHCRERWLKHISPDLKRNEPWTLEEDTTLLKVRKQLGYNGWAEIAKSLPGRTDNAVKRRYRSLTNTRGYSPASQNGPSKLAAEKASKSRS